MRLSLRLATHETGQNAARRGWIPDESYKRPVRLLIRLAESSVLIIAILYYL